MSSQLFQDGVASLCSSEDDESSVAIDCITKAQEMTAALEKTVSLSFGINFIKKYFLKSARMESMATLQEVNYYP